MAQSSTRLRRYKPITSRPPSGSISTHPVDPERRIRRLGKRLKIKVATVNDHYPPNVPLWPSRWRTRLRQSEARSGRLHKPPPPPPLGLKSRRTDQQQAQLFTIPREVRNVIYAYMVDPGLKVTKGFRDTCWLAREELQEEERIYCRKTLGSLQLFGKAVDWKFDYYKRDRFYLFLPGWNIWDLVRIDLHLDKSELSNTISNNTLLKKDRDALTTISTLPGHMVVVTILIKVRRWRETIQEHVMTLEHRIRLFLMDLRCKAEVVVRTKLIEDNGCGWDLVPRHYMLRLRLNESHRERLLEILGV
jgi:hypothetical protein